MSVQVNSTMTVRQTIAVAQVIPSTVIPRVRVADGCSHRMRFYGFPMRNCSASYAGITFEAEQTGFHKAPDGKADRKGIGI